MISDKRLNPFSFFISLRLSVIVGKKHICLTKYKCKNTFFILNWCLIGENSVDLRIFQTSFLIIQQIK